MKTTTFAVLSVLGSAAAQGVTDKISPKGAAPAGCTTSFSGKFEVAVLDVTVAKRDHVVKKRGATCDNAGILIAGLTDGQITDAKSRTGYIADNFQFQFDGPPQAGAIYTSGFSVCGNGSLALGSSTIFYKCQSGSFYNLYDRSWAAQCSPVQISVMPCGAADPPEDVSQIGDGQIVGTTVRATTIVVPLSDGQPQVITTMVPVPLCQITDGQLQAQTTPCASITVAPKQTTTAVPVSQYSDGQIQVTPGSAPPPSTATASSAATTPRTTASVATGTVTASASVSTGGSTLRATTSAASITTSASKSSTQSASQTTSQSTTSTSSTTTAVPASGVRVEMGSVAALVVGILGAVWVL